MDITTPKKPDNCKFCGSLIIKNFKNGLQYDECTKCGAVGTLEKPKKREIKE
jgi:ribosomal protein L37AE/L43A